MLAETMILGYYKKWLGWCGSNAQDRINLQGLMAPNSRFELESSQRAILLKLL